MEPDLRVGGSGRSRPTGALKHSPRQALGSPGEDSW
jgi:hypothetical protein